MKRCIIPFWSACLVLATLLSPVVSHANGFKIQDTQTPAYLTFNQSVYKAAVDQTNVVVTVVRTGDFRKRTSVQFRTESGTALADVDFYSTNGVIEFSPNQSTGSFTVSVKPGRRSEARSLEVRLLEAGPNALITQNKASIVLPATLQSQQSLDPESELKVQSDGPDTIRLSWPASLSDCILETSDSLQQPNWVRVEIIPESLDGQQIVRQSKGASIRFFRLRRP